MADKAKQTQTAKDAEYFDVADWGDIDLTKDYPPGTTMDLGDGKPMDISEAIGHPAKGAKKTPPR